MSDGNTVLQKVNFPIEYQIRNGYNKNLLRTLNKFKGLKYRQQILFENKYLTIINDSKSTSFASSENLLKNLNDVYWILGGIPKKNDQFK